MAEWTAAELKGISDGLRAEALLIVKFRHYAQQTTDPTVRGLCEQLAAQHRRHYETLLQTFTRGE